MAEAGCFANVRLLKQLTRLMKTETGCVGLILDVSKACDTIPHEAIGHALRRKKDFIPDRRVVGGCVSGHLHLNIRPGRRHEITLQRCVKQVDPLSPLLLNLIVKLLLARLESLPGYELPRGANLSCLAFVDDLILVASDASKARDLLDTTVDCLGALGMSLSAPK